MATIQPPPSPQKTGNAQVDSYLRRIYEWAYLMWYWQDSNFLDVEGLQVAPIVKDVSDLVETLQQQVDTLPAQQIYTEMLARVSALEAQPLAQPGASGMKIKAIQRGVITLAGVTSNTATVTAVDTNKATLNNLGCTGDQASAAADLVKVVLTNSTTITATRTSSTGNADVSWELTEWE